uniref:Integrase core domain containing protein n=1 Tax=Solanum tuberosum TaxID=4113 RepID=M1DJI3_SOLTU
MSGSESAHASGSESAHHSGSESAYAAGSSAKSATGSGENDQAASSDEATSSESIPAPRNDDPTPVAGKPNRWCVEGRWKIYRDAKMMNEKQKMARLITEERRVLTGSLHTVPDIHRLFNFHKCDWMARDPGTYSEEIVQEFYALYAATLREFDYRWDIVRSGAFQRNANQREAVLLWLARYIVVDGERAEWVAARRLGIRKATLNFVAKFFWLLVRNRVSPTKADNQVTWDRAVMVAALVAGVEIDFARILLVEIHERAFRTSTTYPFPCLIFHLCRDSGVPIWHCDKLVHPTGALDIGLIRDKANVAAPRREPQIEVPPLGTDLADTVGQAQGGDPIIPDHTDTVPGSSSQEAIMAPSSSPSTPQLGATVVPLARVQKLEAQMATLLRHIQPYMQKLITESEARMEGMMDRKVQAVNKHLDAFELRVLERSAPAIDLFALQADLASLRTDVDAILAAPSVETQDAPTALADDTVLDALFSGIAEEGPAPTHSKGKRHRSHRTEEEKGSQETASAG